MCLWEVMSEDMLGLFAPGKRDVADALLLVGKRRVVQRAPFAVQMRQFLLLQTPSNSFSMQSSSFS